MRACGIGSPPRRRLAWTSLVALAFLAACSDRSAQPEPPNLEALELHPLVRTALEASVAEARRNPGSAKVWGQLGMIFDAHDLLGEAAESYEIASSLDPSEPRWLVFRVLVEPAAPPDRRVQLLSAAEKLDPAHLPLQVLLAKAELDSGAIDRAKERLQRVLASEPAHPHALTWLARIEADSGAWHEAERLLLRARAADPKHREALALLAQAEHKLGAVERAQRTAEAAAALSGTTPIRDPWRDAVRKLRADPAARVARVQQALAEQRVQEARREAEALLAVDPMQADALRLELGHLAHAEGRQQAALVHWTRALERDPKDARVLPLVVEVLSGLGRTQEALDALARAGEERFAVADIVRAEARALVTAARTADAVRLLRARHREAALPARDLLFLVHLLVHAADPAARDGVLALALLQEVPRPTGRDLALHLGLEAGAYAAAGRAAEALAACDAALASLPTHDPARAELAAKRTMIARGDLPIDPKLR